MEIKLKSVFQDRRSALLLKSIVFGVFLWIAEAGGAGFVPAFFFVLALLVLYFSPSFRGGRYLGSFFALTSISLLFMYRVSDPWIVFSATLFLSALSFLLFGVKELVFARTRVFGLLFGLGVTYLATVFLFSVDLALFLRAVIPYGLMVFLVWRDFFFSLIELRRNSHSIHGETSKEILLFGNQNLLAACVAYFAIELIWIMHILPLRASGSAHLVFLSLLALISVILQAVEKKLSKRMVLIDVTVFVLFFVFIFAINT